MDHDIRFRTMKKGGMGEGAHDVRMIEALEDPHPTPRLLLVHFTFRLAFRGTGPHGRCLLASSGWELPEGLKESGMEG